MEILKASTGDQIAECREVILALRPHIASGYLEAMRQTMLSGRTMIYVENDRKVVSVAIFEEGYNLYRGKYIYIDDLSTLPDERGHGYAGMLLDWIFQYASETGVNQVHLDSGVNNERSDAHRLYLNKHFTITSLHFSRQM